MVRAQGHHEIAADVVLYAAFAATGVGVVLPGALLSWLLMRWSLSDQQAGLLFFLFFIGSTSGASLSRGVLSRTIGLGCLCASGGLLSLAIASRGETFFAMLAFGFGLGMTMTSVSLLQSRRYAGTRVVEMARLNLVWACGASIGPAVLIRCAVRWSLAAVLEVVAMIFLAVSMLSIGFVRSVDSPEPAAAVVPRASVLRALPWVLLAMVPLATGIESSVGGWLETYSRRSGLLLEGSISTVTCFWAGILLSRLVQSNRRLAGATQRAVLSVCPWLMSGALLVILLNPHGWYMLAGALALGMGVGPVYPLMLAMMLAYGEAGNVVFVIAGVGASSLPLMTGMVSGWSGSLAAGLSVPLAGALTMAMLATTARRRGLLASGDRAQGV